MLPELTRCSNLGSLLDPSCSGSGIVNRLDYLLEDAEVDVQQGQAARLEKLAGFQLQMILHAFKCESTAPPSG